MPTPPMVQFPPTVFAAALVGSLLFGGVCGFVASRVLAPAAGASASCAPAAARP